jgi:hypothetical protein
MQKNNNLLLKITAGILVSTFSIATVSAAAINTISDTMSSVKVNNLSDHSFTFVTPTGVAAGANIVLTFPGTFSIPAGLSYTDVDINDNGAYIGSTTLAAAPSGSTWGVARTSSTTLTITNGTTPVTAGHALYIRIGTNAIWGVTGSNQITNDLSVGNKSIGITGSFGDFGTTTVHLLSDDTIAVNAIVPQSFTFSISANAINFGNLSASSAKYASSTNVDGDTVDTTAHTLTISSNSSSGYTITLRGKTLTSQQNSIDTITPTGSLPATSSPGSEQFGVYATSLGGVGSTIAATYVTPSSFGFESTATSSSIFATGSSSSGSTVYSLHYIANIGSLTEAGNYSTNLVYVGTANF